MRIRPIGIAGMSMAVWVTAVLVFLAGLPVPAQAEDYYIYVKNSRTKNYNFCTHETGHVPLSENPTSAKQKEATKTVMTAQSTMVDFFRISYSLFLTTIQSV